MGKVQIIRASAGSGKTFRLAQEYVTRVLADENIRPDKFRHILAVTFTNKATEEMKLRIIKELGKLSKKEESQFSNIVCEKLKISIHEASRRAIIVLTSILHDYSHFTVLTIDKFFQRIIRSFTHELGQDINYSIDLQSKQIVERATDIMLDNSNNNPELKRWLVEYIEERIENNKSWDPRQDIVKLGNQLFEQNIFNSDSKKLTKELIRSCVNAARKEYEQAQNLVKQSAIELLDIIRQENIEPADFYRGEKGFINFFCKLAEGNITSPSQAVVNKVTSGEEWCTKSSKKKNTIESLIFKLQPLMLRILEQNQTALKLYYTLSVLYQNYRTFAILPDLRDAIDLYCKDNSILPIADTNKIIEGLVNNNDAPFIYEKIGNTFTDYMLDEFQDTSREQWANFEPLILNAISQSENTNALLVGDVKQSIYRWRGGDWKLLAGEVEKQFESESDTLKENYRSEDIVIRFNNELIKCNLKGYPDGINDNLNNLLTESLNQKTISQSTFDQLYDLPNRAYDSHQQNLPKDKTPDKGYVSVCSIGKDSPQIDNYKYVIDCIEDVQKRGIKASQIAILVRKNDEANEIATALLAHKAQNPDSKFVYDIVTQEALLLKKSVAVKFIIATFNYVSNPNDIISKELFFKFSELNESQCDELFATLRKLPLIRAIDEIIIRVPKLQAPEHIAYVQALHDSIISFSFSNTTDSNDFLKWWKDNCSKLSISLSGEQNAINILTIHKSKGLQYKVVIIPKCNWPMTPLSSTILWSKAENSIAQSLGTVPISFEKITAQSDFSDDYYKELAYSYIDNINLLYVAITRAEYELHIMIPETSSRSSSTRISKFVTQALSQDENGISIGNLKGSIDVQDDDKILYEFGTKYMTEPESAKDDSENKIHILDVNEYPTISPWNSIKFGSKAEHILSKEGPSYSQRYYGSLMHSVLEHYEHGKSIRQIIDKFVAQKKISHSDGIKISQHLEQALTNPLVQDWFSDKWDVVKTEINIIDPSNNKLGRPDRVILRDDKAIVIDYKFGLNILNHHKDQVSRYMKSLKQMGYSDVKGYIWYINHNSVLEVI